MTTGCYGKAESGPMIALRDSAEREHDEAPVFDEGICPFYDQGMVERLSSCWLPGKEAAG